MNPSLVRISQLRMIDSDGPIKGGLTQDAVYEVRVLCVEATDST